MPKPRLPSREALLALCEAESRNRASLRDLEAAKPARVSAFRRKRRRGSATDDP